MYHDFAGREIEDLEMDNMLQDARDEQARAKVTAQMLHEAFASIEQTALDWTDISHEAMRNYTRMAEHINAALDLQAVCSAPDVQDYVWSTSESGEAEEQALQPKVVCLCGSTRFMQAFHDANLRETLAGNIVLSIGCDTKSDEQLHITEEQKAQLDLLHLRKIDLADEVLVLNQGGYVGESTRREIMYAQQQGKAIRWLEVVS